MDRISHRICDVALYAMLATFALSGLDAAAAGPSPLTVDGKPVDTTCLLTLANGDSSRFDAIDLRRCHRTDIVMKHGSPDPAMIGFDYADKDDPNEPRPSYFYYRFLGPYHDHALLFIEFGGGGTGQFSRLVGVDQNGSVLKATEEIAGGDRCNGGIDNAIVSRDGLSYDERVTPFDLIALAGAASRLEAYKDLEASASSCVAVVHHLNKQWISVTLSNPDFQDQTGWTEQYRYQPCFNRIYRGYVARGETRLDRVGVARFASTFEAACRRAR
jgi:hypothetical protein